MKKEQISPQDIDSIHGAANEIDRQRDFVDQMNEIGMQLQGDPMIGDPYCQEAYFIQAEQGQKTIKEIEEALPDQPHLKHK